MWNTCLRSSSNQNGQYRYLNRNNQEAVTQTAQQEKYSEKESKQMHTTGLIYFHSYLAYVNSLYHYAKYKCLRQKKASQVNTGHVGSLYQDTNPVSLNCRMYDLGQTTSLLQLFLIQTTKYA